jgi:hypothetical protein
VDLNTQRCNDLPAGSPIGGGPPSHYHHHYFHVSDLLHLRYVHLHCIHLSDYDFDNDDLEHDIFHDVDHIHLAVDVDCGQHVFIYNRFFIVIFLILVVFLLLPALDRLYNRRFKHSTRHDK